MVLLIAAAVLTAAAALRSAEYDEQYTLFLTAGVTRPVWPDGPFAAGDVRALQAGHAGLAAIARDLRATDVHPPLYFWAEGLWRRGAGSGLFAARLLSVLCGLAALAAVRVIAGRIAVPPALAMLLTLGCYGFAYTCTVARGFALAEALTLWGAAMLLRAKGGRGAALAGGALLGAATFANYLAVFAAAAVLGMRAGPDGRGNKGAAQAVTERARCRWHAGSCFALFLLVDAWFFLFQRGSRATQFPPFHLLQALTRLARYAAASLFGGLPLYLPAPWQEVVGGVLAGFAIACVALVAIRWRHIGSLPRGRALIAAATAAPPIGMLLLGLAFNNTPIELRYLAFATPFAALLLAGALGSLPVRPRRATIAVLACIQAAALAGLVTRPETMQPARATAAAASRLAGGGVILVPRGNDGVGIVGAFAIESPPERRLLVVAADERPDTVRRRIAGADRVVLALLSQDASSRAALPVMREAVADACWEPAGEGFNSVAFARLCAPPAGPAATVKP